MQLIYNKNQGDLTGGNKDKVADYNIRSAFGNYADLKDKVSSQVD